MAATTARYFGFDFFNCVIQTSDGAGTPAIVSTQFLFANKLNLATKDKTITFDGDGQEKDVYLTTGITAEFTPDALDMAGVGTVFGKTKVTTGLPTGWAEGTWYGDLAEAGGVSAGLRGDAHAIKDVAGVQSTVTVRLWIPLGVLTVGKPTGFNTGAKADQMMLRLSAIRTTKDVIGAALPSVPANGAFYMLGELT